MGEVLEFIIEFIVELIVDGGIELTKNKKISKWIRYPIVGIAFIITTAIFGLLFLIGFGLLNETILGGLVILGLTTFLLILAIRKFRKVYIEAKEENEDLLTENSEKNECLLDKYREQKGISPDLR